MYQSMIRALIDVLTTIRRLPVVIYLALSDTRGRYKRSALGPLWLTLGTAIGVAGLGVLWSELLNIPKADFVPSLTAGLICWQFVSGCIVEAPSVFTRQAAVIRNFEQQFFVFPLLLVFRQLVNFAHNMLVLVPVLLFFEVPLTGKTWFVVPIFALVVINLTFLTLTLGMIGSRFRDLEPTIGAFMPLLFFLSPVLYRFDQVPFASQIVTLNPLAYYITILREPMLGRMPTPEIWLTFASISLLVIGAGLWLLIKRRDRIAFWL